MRHAKLLDCTLRDGAYLIDKKFGDIAIRGIIDGLIKAKIDYIEIGFLQNEGFGEGKTVYKNSSDAKRYVPKNKGDSLFTVLADFSRYSVENLDERTDDGIDAVRECFFKHERFDAVEVCKKIKEKGYLVFVQPVDILGYTDKELIEFIELINEAEPYCLSIVDTFGSMYQEDLHRVFELIHHNLIPTCKIGFHSHNNMQLSNALSQEFLRLTTGKRECVIDGTISGMGRGAGNTPIELIAQYMVSQLGYGYDMDAILDVIDGYMNNIRARCEWGYTTPYFIAGCYSAHVNNIAYLTEKNSIRSKDIRYILNKIGAVKRKRYDYDLLESTYMELIHSDIDDGQALRELKEKISGKQILVIVPGKSAAECVEQIKEYVRTANPIVITVNFLHDDIEADYVYMSNIRRFNYWKNSEQFKKTEKILTSNLSEYIDPNDDTLHLVSFVKIVKCGWEYLDNSTLMLLRLLDMLNPAGIALAGFDGYDQSANYANKFLELSSATVNAVELNREIGEMLCDYIETRRCRMADLKFLTSSRFAYCLKKG